MYGINFHIILLILFVGILTVFSNSANAQSVREKKAIEILLYNTLDNRHYMNTPPQYVGITNSGLIRSITIQLSK